MKQNKGGVRSKAKCQYPPCPVTFSDSNPTGLCSKHHEMAVFSQWFLEARLRLGRDGPTLVDVARAVIPLLQEKEEQGTVATLYTADGKRLR